MAILAVSDVNKVDFCAREPVSCGGQVYDIGETGSVYTENELAMFGNSCEAWKYFYLTLETDKGKQYFGSNGVAFEKFDSLAKAKKFSNVDGYMKQLKKIQKETPDGDDGGAGTGEGSDKGA